MAGLQAGGADIAVAGSGDAEFASDGRVEASIMGSGTVTVNGRADCTVSSMGSGKLAELPRSQHVGAERRARGGNRARKPELIDGQAIIGWRQQ